MCVPCIFWRLWLMATTPRTRYQWFTLCERQTFAKSRVWVCQTHHQTFPIYVFGVVPEGCGRGGMGAIYAFRINMTSAVTGKNICVTICDAWTKSRCAALYKRRDSCGAYFSVHDAPSMKFTRARPTFVFIFICLWCWVAAMLRISRILWFITYCAHAGESCSTVLLRCVGFVHDRRILYCEKLYTFRWKSAPVSTDWSSEEMDDLWGWGCSRAR